MYIINYNLFSKIFINMEINLYLYLLFIIFMDIYLMLFLYQHQLDNRYKNFLILWIFNQF